MCVCACLCVEIVGSHTDTTAHHRPNIGEKGRHGKKTEYLSASVLLLCVCVLAMCVNAFR